jgi:hypothetical protein
MEFSLVFSWKGNDVGLYGHYIPEVNICLEYQRKSVDIVVLHVIL